MAFLRSDHLSGVRISACLDLVRSSTSISPFSNFLETNHRKPSKFVPEERNMRSWWKHNKKLMNAGELRPERVEMFERLLELGEKYKHVNQYQ